MAIAIDVTGMCRICLCEDDLVDILLLGEPTAQWMTDINRYFDVQFTFHEDKSTKLCRNCVRKIESWRNDVKCASSCQGVVNFLDRQLKIQIEEDRGRST